jgi:mRNA interferase MazF
MSSTAPARGDVWYADLNPTRGHEQAGKRPVLIVSVNQFNQGPSGLVIVIPISSKDKRVRSQVPIEAGEGGLKSRSFAKCEAVRSISVDRLGGRRQGSVTAETLNAVADCLRLLLDL